MSKMNFDFDEDDYKQDKATYDSKKKRFADKMKLEDATNKVLILGKKSKKESFYHEKVYHEIRNGKSLELMVGCPTADGEECKICAKNWELYEKYKEKMETEKAKNGGQAGKTSKALQVFRKKEDFVVNAINMKDADYKPQMLNLPQAGSKLLFQELEEASAKSIFDLDDGRPMILTTNGKKGIQKRYETVSFAKKGAQLVASGKVEAEQILENLPSLASEKVPYTEAKLDEFLRKALAKFKAQIGDADDDDDDNDDDEDEAPKKKSSKKPVDDDDLDEDDDEDEAPRKKAPAKKKPIDDDDLDEDDDEPVVKKKAPAKKKPVDDDDLDEDDDEDEAPKKKAPAKKKPVDDDDLDEDDDEPVQKKKAPAKKKPVDDDDLDDDDDEPAPKKKASKKPIDDDDLDDDDDEPAPKKKAPAKKPVTDDDFDDDDDEPAPKKKAKRSVIDDDDDE